MATLLAWVLFSVAPPAGAETSRDRVRLSWVRGPGAESCPDARSLESEVSYRIGRDPFAPDGQRTLEGVIARSPQGWYAFITLHDERGASLGVRELTSAEPACTPIHAAAALAVALAIDPQAALRPPAARLPPPAPLTAPQKSDHSAHGAVNAEAIVVFGVLPKAATGVQTGSEWGLAPPIAISIGGAFLSRVDASEPGFSFSLTKGSLGLSAEFWSKRPVHWLGRADLSVGALHSAVENRFARDAGDRLWAAAELSSSLRLDLPSPWFIGAEAAAIVPFTRNTFLDAPGGTVVFEQPALGARLGLGLGLRLP